MSDPITSGIGGAVNEVPPTMQNAEQCANASAYREQGIQPIEPATRPISITPALNGWIVQVGCKTLVFGNLQQLLDEVRNYYTNPKETAIRFLSSKVNNV